MAAGCYNHRLFPLQYCPPISTRATGSSDGIASAEAGNGTQSSSGVDVYAPLPTRKVLVQREVSIRPQQVLAEGPQAKAFSSAHAAPVPPHAVGSTAPAAVCSSRLGEANHQGQQTVAALWVRALGEVVSSTPLQLTAPEHAAALKQSPRRLAFPVSVSVPVEQKSAGAHSSSATSGLIDVPVEHALETSPDVSPALESELDASCAAPLEVHGYFSQFLSPILEERTLKSPAKPALGTRGILEDTCDKEAVESRPGSEGTSDVQDDLLDELDQESCDPSPPDLSQASELHLYLMREMATFVERLRRIEQEVCISARGRLELTAMVRHEEERREELATTFSKALDAERDARSLEHRELRAAVLEIAASILPGGLPSFGTKKSGGVDLPAWCAETVAQEREHIVGLSRSEQAVLARTCRDHRQRLLEDINEKHIHAALDLADRHTEAASALDARFEEILELQTRFQQDLGDVCTRLEQAAVSAASTLVEERLRQHSLELRATVAAPLENAQYFCIATPKHPPPGMAPKSFLNADMLRRLSSQPSVDHQASGLTSAPGSAAEEVCLDEAEMESTTAEELVRKPQASITVSPSVEKVCLETEGSTDTTDSG